MKSEIRTLLDAVLQTDKKEAAFRCGDYSMTLDAGVIELLIKDKPVAKFIRGEYRLLTLDWDYSRENRYFAYRLEQLGFIVNADNSL